MRADTSSWSTQQGDEPTGEEPAVVASPEMCPVPWQNRHGLSGWTLQDTFPDVAVRPESLISAAKAPQAHSCGDTPGWHVGAGHCDLSCSTHRGGHPALTWACNLHRTVAWSQGPSWGGWEKNTLASSIMSAKKAELKKSNLVKEKELDPGGPLSPHEGRRGGVGTETP